jgi:hypothetical protein
MLTILMKSLKIGQQQPKSLPLYTIHTLQNFFYLQGPDPDLFLFCTVPDMVRVKPNE